MKYSIKKQFAYIFIGLMAGTLLLCWFINITFLEKYYTKNRQSALQNAYEQINIAAGNGNIESDEFDIELKKICGKYNISMIVVDADSSLIKSSSNDSGDAKMLTKELFDNIFMTQMNQTKIFDKEVNYIFQNVTDQRTKTDYMEMWGFLDNGNLFLFKTPLESIHESVIIANRFLAYVGLISVLFGALVIWGVSNKVVEPILRLSEISRKMIQLDFEAKYDGKGKNEIALLGNHINQLSSKLESTISELKTANNELKQDIEKKEQVDTMRREFISDVSHELKTPIALIQGYAEGLKEGINEDEESRNFYCDVIMDEAAKMNTMVKKLMTLSQLESGGDTITMERFDVVALIYNTIQSASILTKQNEIEVIMQQTEPIYAWADEFKTEEVIRNYFSNAINHASLEKRIEVKTTIIEDKVRISVFNTGEPIPVESLPYLWDKFFKVDKARTREYGGSGVGLSIVKAIMESMNQQFGVINYADGVEFWFELDIKGI